ncbi:protein CCSMST1 [Simochromis diagramma]|uniref:protein CCSMST1 n=1 Tax=Simochromis diagramma TaxID=43689 RepID=UPI001A7F0AF5|nr:protein CCSMST1 [Simochromis diagramma]
MSIAAVFARLTRVALSRGTFIHSGAATVRLHSVRSLALSSQLSCKSKQSADDEVKSEPMKFSTSKASHRTWRVDRSMGSQYERPMWKVVPISLLATAFLLWCAFRDETDIDAALEKQLHEHVPSVLSNEEDTAKK